MKKLILIPITLFAVACSSQSKIPGQTPVIVDTKGVDMSSYQADLADCEHFAQEVPVVEKAVAEAAVHAAVGAVIGSVVRRQSSGDGVAVGAVLGAVSGTSHGLEEQRAVVRNCMRGRGYRVLI